MEDVKEVIIDYLDMVWGMSYESQQLLQMSLTERDPALRKDYWKKSDNLMESKYESHWGISQILLLKKLEII